jgi:hypothetical protein
MVLRVHCIGDAAHPSEFCFDSEIVWLGFDAACIAHAHLARVLRLVFLAYDCSSSTHLLCMRYGLILRSLVPLCLRSSEDLMDLKDYKK